MLGWGAGRGGGWVGCGVGPRDGGPGGRPGGCAGWSGVPGGAAGGLGGWWGGADGLGTGSVLGISPPLASRFTQSLGRTTWMCNIWLPVYRLHLITAPRIGGCVYTPEDSCWRAPPGNRDS